MSKNEIDFQNRLKEIKDRLRYKDVEVKKLKKEELRAIQKVEKEFDDKRSKIIQRKRDLENDLSELRKKCPNVLEHERAVKTNKEKERKNLAGEEYTCCVCEFHLHVYVDERL